ncbi:AAA family ATPase [Candidatus Marithrix sp. Canyon 246]|uniref:AAA family ATPase n=1 Tax=Candidatus Marithrix sp. Canyon 246 TaxID=1827136 RepID=UPI00084A1ACD|nr:AAA family ATPase [Candidatus Marithrix sp. Canyon 246]
MNEKKLLNTIRLENILSYSTGMKTLTFESLNVLIGTNASGKSNLIEIISLLAATPNNLLIPIRQGGGIMEWLWKGSDSASPIASIDSCWQNIQYQLSFTCSGNRFELVNEMVKATTDNNPLIYYAYQNGYPTLNMLIDSEQNLRTERQLQRQDVSIEQSILSQRRGADLYPELTHLSSQFNQIRFYREWNLGHYAIMRMPQKADLPNEFLLEDASNLGLVINNLQNNPQVKQQLLSLLQEFYEYIEDITTKTEGNTIQIFFHERGLRQPVPATRLSDGTLRYLCLLTILCHPKPPPLVCIEEPELGLHPDILPSIVPLLKECAERTQLIVTTHSDVIVDALTDIPESIIVCDRDENGTHLKRLNQTELEVWLQEYSLAELWRSGEIGGNRW